MSERRAVRSVSAPVAALAALALASGCKRSAPRSRPAEPALGEESPRPLSAAAASAATPGCEDLPKIPLRHPAAGRVVAIGDIHGDLAAARAALRLAGAIDDADRWIGGDLVVVQTGDVLDRGDGEQAILDLFSRLEREARAAGGAVHALNGNHELMNADGDFQDVTPGGFSDFADVDGLDAGRPALRGVPDEMRARVAALSPGGPYARLLSERNVAVIVGDTVFVHGGVMPSFAEYGLDRLNREVRCWLRGGGPRPEYVDDPRSPVWSRAYSTPPEACDELASALRTLGVSRMVVGHTVQILGINPACDGRVWRIDVGLSAFYGGPIQVLEIRGAEVRVLRASR